MKKNLVAIMLIATVAISIAMGAFYQYGRSLWYPVVSKYMGKQTVAEVIAQYSDQTKDNLAPLFAAQGIVYPPKNLALLAFKDTALLEVWAANADEEFKKITEYPVLAASGKLGPKLREGDKQVPEGIYNIAGFNPNSAYHLSMQVNYPNDFDLQHAKTEGRDSPGTNIFIHGRSASVGCLAMGDPAIEDLFTLVYETGIAHTQVLISPSDPRISNLAVPADAPVWTQDLYQQLEKNINKIIQHKS